jgi:hypothetical protein
MEINVSKGTERNNHNNTLFIPFMHYVTVLQPLGTLPKTLV